MATEKTADKDLLQFLGTGSTKNKSNFSEVQRIAKVVNGTVTEKKVPGKY